MQDPGAPLAGSRRAQQRRCPSLGLHERLGIRRSRAHAGLLRPRRGAQQPRQPPLLRRAAPIDRRPG
eukprot:8762722-Lingulodinium_polyedra.AAC.1